MWLVLNTERLGETLSERIKDERNQVAQNGGQLKKWRSKIEKIWFVLTQEVPEFLVLWRQLSNTGEDLGIFLKPSVRRRILTCLFCNRVALTLIMSQLRTFHNTCCTEAKEVSHEWIIGLKYCILVNPYITTQGSHKILWLLLLVLWVFSGEIDNGKSWCRRWSSTLNTIYALFWCL